MPVCDRMTEGLNGREELDVSVGGKEPEEEDEAAIFEGGTDGAWRVEADSDGCPLDAVCSVLG